MLIIYDTKGDAVIFREKVFANDILPSHSLGILNFDNALEENWLPLLTGTAVVLNEAILNHPWPSGVLNM